MATASLRGFWGLEQLDRLGWSIRKINVALALTGILVSLSVTASSYFFGLQIPVTSLIHNFLIAVSLIYFSACIALARFVERDYKNLVSVDPNTSKPASLSPPRKLLGFTCFACCSLMFGIDVWLFGGRSGLSFGFDGVVLWLLMVPLYGFALGLLLTTCVHQSRIMCQTVRTLSFDLTQLAELQHASMPLLPISAFLSLFVSAWAFAVELGGFPKVIYLFITPLSLGAVCLFFLPVLLMRRRIKSKKEEGLKRIMAMIAESKSQDEHERTGRSALLTEQMFIESRGEWPVGALIQKLVLFGLLPPLSWALAAKMENLVN